MSARRASAAMIARARMGDRDGGVRREQQLRHRPADEIGTAEHERLLAGDLSGKRIFDQHQHAQGRTGDETVCRARTRRARDGRH